jgi:DNA ligase (NAD+)
MELHTVEGVGEIVAESIAAYVQVVAHQHQIARMQTLGVQIMPYEQVGGPLTGKTFVFTGTLETMPRPDAWAAVRARGGDASETISKKISYVVVGADAGSKKAKAEKLGVPTLTEAEFLAILQAASA